MNTITIGDNSDNVTLQIHGRTNATVQDYWDANWLHCTANVSAGMFRGTVNWQLRNEDLARFMDALRLIQVQPGEAVLETGDGWLDIRVTRQNSDNVNVSCQLVDDPNGGNSMEVRLPCSMAGLAALTEQIRVVLDAFPVIGRAT